jgi:hypothetical protein
VARDQGRGSLEARDEPVEGLVWVGALPDDTFERDEPGHRRLRLDAGRRQLEERRTISGHRQEQLRGPQHEVRRA